MQRIEPGWERLISVCWILIWRGALGGALFGFVPGLVVNLMFGLASGIVLGACASKAAGLLVTLLWWTVAVRIALRKKCNDSRIALVAQPI
jgi:hypothetical protein